MKYQINLFPAKEENIIDRIIYFSFHYLRYILVLTQLVVILVFFYRFNIDQEIVDTKDNLNQKQEIVHVSSALIADAETVNQQITYISKTLRDQQTFSDMMSYVLSLFPQDITLTKMEADTNDMTMEGLTNDNNVIKAFYYRLQQEHRFQTIQLVNVKKTELGFTFQLHLATFIVKNHG